MLAPKDFQPLQLLGCYNRFYTCVRRDEEPEKFSFGANYRDVNGKKAVAYHQVIDVTNVEQYDFARDIGAVRYCDSESQHSICSAGYSERSGRKATNTLYSIPGSEKDLPNNRPTVTSNVRSVSQPRQWQCENNF